MLETVKGTPSTPLPLRISAYEYIQNVLTQEKAIASSDIWKSAKDEILDITEKFKDTLERSIDSRFGVLIKD